MALSNNPMFSPENLLMLSGNILAGPNFGAGVGTGLQQLGSNLAAQKKAQEERQKQMQEQTQAANFLRQQNPGVDLSNYTPGMINAAASTTLEKQLNPAKPEFKVFDDGSYGTWDGQKVTILGKASKPEKLPAIAEEYKYAQSQGFKGSFDDYRQSKTPGTQTFEERKRIADELGIAEGDPRRESYLATGKFPREDQQQLTAVDKTAILEADEMVAVNEGAINALKQAKEMSPKANAGWLSGTRATIGNNLPDWMVPDDISSPDSSAATQNFDNAIVGQALTQLKAIFGGAPTEGERKILLELQGSSNLQPAVREDIIDRAIAAAERRLEFNRQRADQMRGGTYYKPNSAETPQPTSVDGANTTSTGVKWKVPGQ